METRIRVHSGWYAGKLVGTLGSSIFYKKHWLFSWNQHHASLIAIKNTISGKWMWEIWVDDEPHPSSHGSRNLCLHYMYKKWLGLRK